jgi:hypothetical protein
LFGALLLELAATIYELMFRQDGSLQASVAQALALPYLIKVLD